MMLAELIAIMNAPPARDAVTQAAPVGEPLRRDGGAMAVMIYITSKVGAPAFLISHNLAQVSPDCGNLNGRHVGHHRDLR